jgi:excisionase family DNA binding protein
LETYVDAKTAARRLNLPVDTIYRLIETGKLPALRFPVRIRLSDLDTVLDRTQASVQLGSYCGGTKGCMGHSGDRLVERDQ